MWRTEIGDEMKHWIKLWPELLYDPKMAQLDDHLWRVAVSCFLLAGEVDQHGGLLIRFFTVLS